MARKDPTEQPFFVDDLPPQTRAQDPEILAYVEQLQAHPGVWARWAQGQTRGAGGKFRRYGCEVAVRQTSDDTWDVYVRWPAS